MLNFNHHFPCREISLSIPVPFPGSAEDVDCASIRLQGNYRQIAGMVDSSYLPVHNRHGHFDECSEAKSQGWEEISRCARNDDNHQIIGWDRLWRRLHDASFLWARKEKSATPCRENMVICYSSRSDGKVGKIYLAGGARAPGLRSHAGAWELSKRSPPYGDHNKRCWPR